MKTIISELPPDGQVISLYRQADRALALLPKTSTKKWQRGVRYDLRKIRNVVWRVLGSSMPTGMSVFRRPILHVCRVRAIRELNFAVTTSQCTSNVYCSASDSNSLLKTPGEGGRWTMYCLYCVYAHPELMLSPPKNGINKKK